MFKKIWMKLVLLWTLMVPSMKANQSPKRTEGKLIPLQLQFFADGAGEDDPPPADPPGGNEPPSTDPPPADPPQTFTQEDVNSIAAKEAKKAQEKLLKQLGIDDFDSAKDGLAKFKEWQESQKTEAEKQAERLKELETNFTSTSDENTSLKAQISAMKAGVSAESVEDVVTLAKTMVSDELDMDAAISKVVEKYPHFKAQQEEQKEEDKKPSFSTGQHQKQQPSEMDVWFEAFGVKK